MTPDGISAEDWDQVHELVLEVVNNSAEGESSASHSASLRLRALLDELQEKYGPLPSLLATRADYVDNPVEREYWLLAAYHQAEERRDDKNLVWIAASLATFHVEEVPDPMKGKQWLESLERHLQAFPDTSETEEAVRLRAILERLRHQPQNNELQRTRPAQAKEPRR
jgi:hypothetical protein